MVFCVRVAHPIVFILVLFKDLGQNSMSSFVVMSTEKLAETQQLVIFLVCKIVGMCTLNRSIICAHLSLLGQRMCDV